LTAEEDFGLTQTNGAGSAISISGSFEDDRPIHDSEPMTIAVFGVSLLGLAYCAALSRHPENERQHRTA
jgi:hypothetical protein